MFSVNSHAANGHGNDGQDTSFLYDDHHDLLGNSILTPESDIKVEAHVPKSETHAFGTFDTLGIYKEYDDSGPSSMQLDEDNGTPDIGGNQIVSKDDISIISSNFIRGTATSNTASQSPIPSLNITQPAFNEQFMAPSSTTSLKVTSVVQLQSNDPMSPIQQQLLAGPSTSDSATSNASLKRKRLSSEAQDGSTSRGSAKKVKTTQWLTKLNAKNFRARSAIPQKLSWVEFGRQGILAAYSLRLNPFALHPDEYQLLKPHITKSQVTIYLNIRNAILRLFHRTPLVPVQRSEAAGCARDSRYFQLSQVAYDWLLRKGYINFGGVDATNTEGPIPQSRKKDKRNTVIVIGAGMSGLGCARQLEALFASYGEQFTESGQRPPKVIVLEGRPRLGGRIYSHAFKQQKPDLLPQNCRNTAEMGAHIITGFDHGNPLNILVRGQQGLHYHFLKDDSVLYDTDGKPVDKKRDVMIQELYNDILDRVSAFRAKLPTKQTVEGDHDLIRLGEDPRDGQSDAAQTLGALETAGEQITVADGNPLDSDTISPALAFSGVEKVAGRQYQLAGGTGKKTTPMEATKAMGFETRADFATPIIDLEPISKASAYPTLGETMDEGIKQYQNIVDLTAQDLRLWNWHQANLEYANATSVDNLSLSGWDQDGGNEFEGAHCQIIGGYQKVPRVLAKFPSQLDIRYNHVASSIETHDEKSRNSPVVVKCANGEVLEADHVVVTVPLGVLKKDVIKFNPPLPDWKTSCIERMGYGLLNKVVLLYDKPFWEVDRDMFGLLNAPIENELDPQSYKNCRGRFYFFWNCIKTSGLPVLIALMTGPAAYSVEESSNDELVKEATRRLRQIFGRENVPLPKEYYIVRWLKDPFSYGSYSYVARKTQTGDYDVMAKPVGRVFFAGEATCGTHPATVHGAYISGLRAAGEVLENMLGPIKVPDPLIPKKVKAEHHSPPANLTPDGIKHKKGYVSIWEPINPPPLPATNEKVNTEAEDYEAKIIGAILEELGERPIKPDKMEVVNPYLLYSYDHWYDIKSVLEAKKSAAAGKTIKVERDEVRRAVGEQWRNLPEDEKQPYVLKADQAHKSNAEILEKIKTWDKKAERVRREFVAKNPPPKGVSGSKEPSAIEVGSGRKNRKLSGYQE